MHHLQSLLLTDFCGPLIVKEGRKELKRYSVIFTCLVSHAVHLEVANALSTSSFSKSLRHLLSICSSIALLRVDRGTNFVGVNRELNQAWSEINDVVVLNFLLENNSLFEFKFNPPSVSHFGGIWERFIRSCRSILDGILVKHGTQLDDESLRTYLAEIASILNSRPLTRQKWCLSDDNLQVGDICVLKDESLCRNQWPLCRVGKVYMSDDGFIRSVQICVGDRALNDKGQRVHKVSRLDKPVAKLVFLCRP